jgi:hypothetical protein
MLAGRPHPADEALGADWVPPGQRLLEHAWREHDRRDELVELQAERDADGRKTWMTVRVDDRADGWVEHWLRPVDPLDPREPIRIAAWPLKLEADALADAKAVVDEHDLGPP